MKSLFFEHPEAISIPAMVLWSDTKEMGLGQLPSLWTNFQFCELVKESPLPGSQQGWDCFGVFGKGSMGPQPGAMELGLPCDSSWLQE
jgi:hypothetical protein